MRRFDKITGRSDDMMIIRGVNVFPSQIEELILKQPELAPHYQLELTRSGNLDALAVNVELKPGVDAGAGDRGRRPTAAQYKDLHRRKYPCQYSR